jgi:hypothetical protein
MPPGRFLCSVAGVPCSMPWRPRQGYGDKSPPAGARRRELRGHAACLDLPGSRPRRTRRGPRRSPGSPAGRRRRAARQAVNSATRSALPPPPSLGSDRYPRAFIDWKLSARFREVVVGGARTGLNGVTRSYLRFRRCGRPGPPGHADVPDGQKRPGKGRTLGPKRPRRYRGHSTSCLRAQIGAKQRRCAPRHRPAQARARHASFVRSEHGGEGQGERASVGPRGVTKRERLHLATTATCLSAGTARPNPGHAGQAKMAS